METHWTREQVEELLRRETFSYQRIALPYGLATAGADRSQTANAIFPQTLAGKSVLDLGCSNGFFCFEAARRGARRVLGVDVQPDTIRKNRILADILGHRSVEFQTVDLDRDRITETFDYVLGLNVIHHLRYPLLTLDNLADITREKLILEMVSFGLADSLRMGISPLLAPLVSRLPVIFVSPGHARKKLKRTVITKRSLHHLLMTHRRVFSQFETRPSEFKGRYIAEACKYNIDHLLVVAGPTGSNPESFAARLAQGELASVQNKLGLALRGAPMLPVKGDGKLPLAIMTYDILNPFMRTGVVYQRDVELDLLSAAQKVTMLTLKPSARALAAAFAPLMGKGKLFGGPSKRQKKILESYQDEESLQRHYQSWLEFAGAAGRTSLVAELGAGGEVNLVRA